MTLLGAIAGVVALVIGIGLGWLFRQMKATNTKNSAEAKAENLLKDTKNKQQETLLDAKEKALAIIEEAKKEEKERRDEARQTQERLEKRESMFDARLMEIEEQKEKIQNKAKEVEEVKEEVLAIKEQQAEALQEVAGLSREDAEERLMQRVEESAHETLANRIHKLEKESDTVWDEKARDILTNAIHRCGMSHAAETTSTVVHLTSDDMKGRIIGKEGRNIKRIEDLTGVEIIVDETPETILLSAFSPIRRHLAKRTLEALMSDGRIHPARIEEAVEIAKKGLQDEIRQAGEEALFEMGITGIDPKLVQILGRLRYRTSYGQNVLRHSIEVGTVAGLIAEQMGADVAMARKAGLFHDIGKALDHDIQGTHPEIGRDIGRKFSFNQELSDAAFCHHDDYPPSVEGIIVKVADAISGSRPGARKDSYEQYVQRMEELEDTAKTFEGVQKAWAMQAGREIRVFVEPAQIDDYQAHDMAKNIATKIEADLKYPGEIKVNVIREKRIIEYAR